jgi:hypothetical protein
LLRRASFYLTFTTNFQSGHTARIDVVMVHVMVVGGDETH